MSGAAGALFSQPLRGGCATGAGDGAVSVGCVARADGAALNDVRHF